MKQATKECSASGVVKLSTGSLRTTRPVLVDTYRPYKPRDYTERDYVDQNRQRATRTASPHSVAHKDLDQVLVNSLRNFKRVGNWAKAAEYEQKLCVHLGVSSMREVRLSDYPYENRPQPPAPRLTHRDQHLLRAQQ